MLIQIWDFQCSCNIYINIQTRTDFKRFLAVVGRKYLAVDKKLFPNSEKSRKYKNPYSISITWRNQKTSVQTSENFAKDKFLPELEKSGEALKSHAGDIKESIRWA